MDGNVGSMRRAASSRIFPSFNCATNTLCPCPTAQCQPHMVLPFPFVYMQQRLVGMRGLYITFFVYSTAQRLCIMLTLPGCMAIIEPMRSERTAIIITLHGEGFRA